jgi:hypothetical protein
VGATLALFRFSAQAPSFALPWRRRARARAEVAARAAAATSELPGAALAVPTRAATARLTAAWAGVRDRSATLPLVGAVTRLAFASMVRQVTFLAIATVGAVNVFMTAWYADRQDQVRVHPRTYLIADAIVGGFGLFFIILLTMFVGEMVWRERQQHTDQIQDALPVGPGVHLAGRLLALVGAMAMLQLVMIGAGMLVQTIKGYTNYELTVYLRTIYLIEFPFVLQYALLAFAVHALVNNKAVGHVVLIGFWVANIVMETMGYDHRLLTFGYTTPYQYSDMNGYGHFVPRLATFIGYWTFFAAGLGVLAYLYWVRGTETAWRIRRRAAAARFAAPARLGLSGAGVGMLGVGAFAFWNTNVLHPYRNRDDRQALQAEFERRYKAAYERVPLPRLVAVEVDADLRPETRRYRLTGAKWYVNRGPRAVDTLPMTIGELAQYPGEYRVETLRWSRPVRPLVADSTHGFLAWRLERPLAVGDSLRLDFAVSYAPRGFALGPTNTRIVENGTFVDYSAVPGIGYSREAELAEDRDRKKQKLAPRPLVFARDDTARWAYSDFGLEGDRVRFRATVRTAPDQVALAPGTLESERMEGGGACSGTWRTRR